MKRNLLVAACASALSVTPEQNRLVLMREGTYKGIDGRPVGLVGWTLTPANGKKIVAALNSQSIDMVIDYEHATLLAKQTGSQAPAAGWCTTGKFEYVDGVGICSTAWSWTPQAAAQIAAQEYRYLSPVFMHDDAGQIFALLHASLTNTPNLDNLPEATLAAAAQDFFNQQQDSKMDELLEQLRWMLNLPLSATAEEIMAELAKLQGQIKEKLGVTLAANAQNLFDVVGAVMAANSQALPDPAKYAPIAVVTDLQTQIATLTAASAAGAVDQLITAACSDGRLRGDAHIAWARDLGKANPAALKAHLDAAPKIPALTAQQTTIAANSQQHQTPNPKDDYESQIAAQMGLA